MCGIFTLLNNKGKYNNEFIKKQFIKGKGRGPEFSILQPEFYDYILGFHRLAINGIDKKSNQPLILNNELILICNGEIYNYKELYHLMNIEPNTNSDCEIILHLYKHYGMMQTLRMLDGVFAFVLLDLRIMNDEPLLYVARDPFGVRPLYMLNSDDVNNTLIGFASEMKMLFEFKDYGYDINHFQPGTCEMYRHSTGLCANWQYNNYVKYHNITFESILNVSNQRYSMQNIYNNIIFYLKNAVYKRCRNTDRQVACLLSGGLDSSLICALVCEFNRENGLPPPETYSIGLFGSQDLKYAKTVSHFLQTFHTEIIVSEDEFVNEIENVIYAIESYDTTTIRASLGNYILGKYISQNSNAKVIFNGDGSDELCGGYLYFHYAPDSIEFDSECNSLLDNIHKYDVLRSDKCISCHGLEPRTPFLDRSWCQYYMSIPIDIRNHNKFGYIEKYLLRTAFNKDNYGSTLLPYEILWRSKEAFSDGVSIQSRSLFEIIQEQIASKTIKNIYNEKTNYVEPKTKEQQYYLMLFDKYYKGCGNIISKYWMPRYIDADDASARTLDIYQKKNNNVITGLSDDTDTMMMNAIV